MHRTTPYILHLTPYTPHPTPYTLHPTPYTLHPTPYTLNPTFHRKLPESVQEDSGNAHDNILRGEEGLEGPGLEGASEREEFRVKGRTKKKGRREGLGSQV